MSTERIGGNRSRPWYMARPKPQWKPGPVIGITIAAPQREAADIDAFRLHRRDGVVVARA